MKKLDILPTVNEASRVDLSGAAVVIIDVLRATTSMLYIFNSAARAVYPVGEVGAARIKKEQMPDALLCGERNGVPPPGFDMGNSPVVFKDADLWDRDVILTTTNGTQAVECSKNAELVVTGAFSNASAVAGFLHKNAHRLPVYLLCAGTRGAFSIEDFFCAGLIAARLASLGGVTLTDVGWAAVKLSELPVESVVNEQTCGHLDFLVREGFREDVELSLL